MKKVVSFLFFAFWTLYAGAQGGNSLNFDGIDDFAENSSTSNLPMGNAPRTLEGWFRTSGGPAVMNLFGYGNSTGNNRAAIVIMPSGLLRYVGEGNDLQTTTPAVDDGTWHHVAAVYTGGATGTLSIYVDAVFSASMVTNFNTSGNVLRLGQRTGPQDLEFYNGELDEVRIWDRPLCLAEIQFNRNCEVPVASTGLVAYYRFNQGTANGNNTAITTVTDLTSSGNHATLSGFTRTGSNSNFVSTSGVTTGNSCGTYVPVNLVIAAPLTACEGAVTTLTAVGATSYTWSPVAGNGNTINVTPTITTIYQVAGTHTNGCVGITRQSISVSPLPTVAISGNTAICNGASASFTATGANTYTWSTTATGSVLTVTPSSTTPYTVTGTDANGCRNSASRTLTVNALPTVTITGSTTICNGSSTTLTAGGANTYSWSTTSTNTAITVSPGSTTPYTVTGTDANGCKGVDIKTVTVNALPPVGITGHTAICVGFSAALTGTGATTYSWSTGSTNTVINVTPGSTTPYTVTGTDGNGCRNMDVKTVTIFPLPTLTITGNPSLSGNPAICIGGTGTLTGTGASTYTWFPMATTGSVLIQSPSSSTPYTLTGTDGNGCVNSKTVTLIVNALPSVSATATRTLICLNDMITLNGGGASTYTWSGGSPTPTNGIAFAPTVTNTYTVKGTDLNTCTNTAVVAVTVQPLPPVGVSATTLAVCMGFSTAIQGTGAVTYTWTGGITDNTPFIPAQTSTYVVTGTAVNTCTNSAVAIVTVNPLPTVTASASQSLICQGYTTSLHGGGASTYVWTGTVTNAVAFTPTQTATYTVTGTDTKGCKNTAVQTISVNPSPTVSATASTPTLCSGASATLTGGGATSYTWTNGVTDGVTFNPTVTTTYTVSGSDANGCISSATVAILVTPLPTVTASADKHEICLGGSVTLNGAGATTYTWANNVPNGTPISPTVNTTYSVSGTMGGCASSNTAVITITVNALPTITVSNGTICAGGSFVLTPSGASTYTYINGGPSVNPTSTTQYSVTGTNAKGCISATAGIGTVFVNALPTINLGALQTSVCVGSSITINASGASTYTWDSGATGQDLVVSPSANTTYTVTGTDTQSCVSTGTILITTVALPTVGISPANPGVCKGFSITLTASGADSYAWSSGQASSSVTVGPQATTVYTVTGTSGTNCSSSRTISLVVNAIPTVEIGPDLEIPINMPYQLNVTQTGASTYTWSGSAGLSDANVLNPEVTLKEQTTYTLTAMSSRGCVATDVITINVVDGLIIANYVTPNGDGKNDAWKISNLYQIKDYSVEVIDSWGKSVFKRENSYNNDFTADDLPDGVYYYFIADGQKLMYKGSITVTH